MKLEVINRAGGNESFYRSDVISCAPYPEFCDIKLTGGKIVRVSNSYIGKTKVNNINNGYISSVIHNSVFDMVYNNENQFSFSKRKIVIPVIKDKGI